MHERSRQTVLVVEDDAAIRGLIVRALDRDGYRVITASTGAEGLAAFQAHPDTIELAILDMVMPGMSGLDLANELRSVRTDLTLLYISGYVDSIAMDSIARHCPEAVLLKPFDKGALVARVRQLLSPSHPETPFVNCSKSTPGPATGS